MNTFFKALLALLLYSLLLNLPYFHLKEFQGEEGRRVNIAVNMVETGEWVVPRHEGSVYLKKPPLFNYLLAGMFKITGVVSEPSARAVSIVAAFLNALILSLFWRKAADIKGAWFILPGLIFLTFSDVIDKAVRAEIDMTFTLFVTLSLVLWFYLYEIKGKSFPAWTVSMSFLGFSALTKGVQAPLFFYSGVIPYLIYRKETRRIFSFPHLAGISAALIVFSLWAVPLVKEIGLEKVMDVWWKEIAARKEPIREGGFLKHFIEFPFLYIKAYMPWLPFITLWIYKPLRGEPDTMVKKSAFFSLFCLLFSIPLYWVIPGARLRYVLPVSGMSALLIAIPLNSVLDRTIREPVWCGRYLKGLGAVLILLVVSSPFWGKRLELFGSASSIALLGGVFIIAFLLIREKKLFQRKIAFLLIAVLLAKVLWASFYFPYHARYMSYYRNAAQRINGLVSPDAALYDYRVDNDHLAFYLKRPVKYVDSLVATAVEEGSVIYMEKDVAEGLNTDSLSYLGTVKARSTVLVLYRVTGHD